VNPVASALVATFLVAAITIEWWVTERAVGPTASQRHSKNTKLLQIADLVYLPKTDHIATGLDRSTRFILVGSSFGGVLLAWGVAAALPSAALIPPATAIVIGMIVMGSGASLRIWSIKRLGKNFSRVVEIQTQHELICTGPYRLIRNPAYCGGILVFLGIGIVTGNWVSALLAVIVPLAGRVPRVLAEEQALKATFGHEYTDYMERTTRFIPWIV
jgi:protein-S-isoprenylcysteine O-methyltransferase Ste14